ncbi:MAG TPA: NAD(P)-dependent oxidoreductase [Hyphomicrobiaceae bacterium]|nr:NAD(P)-dependent oxidoreductase [Hyphomicrobiaceae bacterium]
MRILLAGATGAVGRSLLPRLVAAGHEVIGTTRSEMKVGLIRQHGGEALVADGLDAEAMRRAVLSARPDVIVHEMTDLKGASDLRHFDRLFAASNRLRTEGTDHLLAAAREAGVSRFVAQSFCGWPYARTGGAVKLEDDPLDPEPPRQLRRTLDAIRYVEKTVAQASGIDGIVLRYGAFYGPDTGLFDGPFIEQVLRRRVPVIGGGDGWWSFVHIEDAAAATTLAIDRGVAGNIYNIVDDEPAPMREWLPTLASMLGAGPPRHVPAWLGRLAAGEHLVAMMTRQRAGSNAKAKRDLGWLPAHSSWRQGFAEIVRHRSTAGRS